MPTYGTVANAPFAPTGSSIFFRINNGKNTGPYFHGGFYYASGFYADSSIIPYARLAIYKSADGVTWTAIDSAHWPYVTWTSEFYPAAGGSVVYFCYFNGDIALNGITDYTLDTGGRNYAVNDTGTINGGAATYQITSIGSLGEATGITFFSSGGGYSVANKVGTTTGGGQPGVGTGLVVNIKTISGGGDITSLAISNSTGGSAYVVGDTGTINGGTPLAQYQVTSEDSGVVLSIGNLITHGGAYSIANGVATTDGGSQPGVGTGLKVNITAIGGSPGGGEGTPVLQLASFDMATDLFTVISTAGPMLTLGWSGATGYEPPLLGTNPLNELQFVRDSSGKFVIMYGTQNVSGFYEVDMVTFSSSTWGSPALLSSVGVANENGYAPFGIGITPTDQVYMLWVSGDDADIHSSLYASGSLSAPTLAHHFATSDYFPFTMTWPTMAFYDSGIDSLIWNFPLKIDSTTDWQVELLVAANVSTSATFSVVNTGAVAPGVTVTRGTQAFVKDSGTYFVYYVSESLVSPSHAAQISVVSAATLSGSWSAPSIFWDWPAVNSLNPPPAGGALGNFDQIAWITISNLAAGPAFTIFQELLPTTGSQEPGSGVEFLLLPQTPPPALSIACPIGGGAATVGVPYNSGPPVVTGNPTLPLTFSLAGGSLPPGMTLDPVTGSVSGTTFQAGTFSYTIEVTDSSSPPLQAQVSEPCSIPVSPGTVSLPCAEITPNPSIDVRFKLIKVMATMKPATHLPTRGSVT